MGADPRSQVTGACGGRRSGWPPRRHRELPAARKHRLAATRLLSPGPVRRSAGARCWHRQADDRLARGRNEDAPLVAAVLEHARDQLSRALPLRPVHASQRVPALRDLQPRRVISEEEKREREIRQKLDEVVGNGFDAPLTHGFTQWLRTRWIKWLLGALFG